MSSTLISVDREVVEHSFREWQQEQSLLDEQLAESVAALDAYQAHLDNWQHELAREREELRLLRESAVLGQSGTGPDPQLIEHLNKELEEAREKIALLTTALLARTEELRDLDHQREGTNTELTRAREREKELAAALAAQQQASEVQRHHGEKQPNHQHDSNDKAADHSAAGNHGDSVRNGAAKAEPRRGASPVLGSVMEQFGKLREQRSMNRSNNKPR